MRLHRGGQNIYHIGFEGTLTIKQGVSFELPYGLLCDGNALATCTTVTGGDIDVSDATSEAWYKTAGETGWEVLFQRQDNNWIIAIDHNDGHIFSWHKVTDSADVEWSAAGDQCASIWDGNWHHLAAVHDISAGTCVLYLDGTALTNNRANPNNTDGFKSLVSSGVLWVCSQNAGAGTNGTIDELRFSNTARYTANFAAPTARFTADANTIVLYHFQENTGTTTADDSGNDNDLTFSAGANAPAWATGKFV